MVSGKWLVASGKGGEERLRLRLSGAKLVSSEWSVASGKWQAVSSKWQVASGNGGREVERQRGQMRAGLVRKARKARQARWVSGRREESVRYQALFMPSAESHGGALPIPQ